MKSTVDDREIEKFNKIAGEWWQANGKFKPLHQFNPIRLTYIKEQLLNYFKLDINQKAPLSTLKILDVGCGGGLLCEPLSRLGANLVGIDMGEKNIAAAKIHSKEGNLDIDYRQQDVEELASLDEKFDVVLAMEIIEHVKDVEKFLKAAKSCLKPNGLLFVATLNRTAKSYLNAIIGAEYVLRWLPKGTHDWKKFLKPSEINRIAEQNDLKLIDLTGFDYSLIKDEWRRTKDVSVNYVMVLTPCN